MKNRIKRKPKVTNFLTKTFVKITPNALCRALSLRLVNSSLAFEIEFLQRQGLFVGVVYDIGAHKGKFSKELKKVLPDAEYILFEANEVHRDELKKSGFNFYTMALADVDGQKQFYGLGGTGDSFYRENSSVYDDTEPKLIEVYSLDTLVRTEGLTTPDLIKIDTQGSEIDILKGSGKTLAGTSLIYLECPLTNYNDGAPDISAYLGFLETIGFVPWSINEFHRSAGKLAQIDILFVRKTLIGDLDLQ